MNTITKSLVLLILCLAFNSVNAQDSITNKKTALKIKQLEDAKSSVQKEERDLLKEEVEAINKRLEEEEITEEEAENLKTEAAKKRALNIEDRLSIINNKIALMKRNDGEYKNDSDNVVLLGLEIGSEKSYIKIKDGKRKPKKYDRRTVSHLVFAAGFNNVLSDESSIGDDYNVMGSGFAELGWAWRTRVFKESNWLRFKYGFSFQWNKLNPKDNKYFVQDGNETNLVEFPNDLNKSEFRNTNLVMPIHFEFGPSKKIEHDDYFRYSTRKQLKIGIGAYGGFNIGTQQKLKYKEDGDRVKQKIRRNYNTSDFVYGLSAYIGLDVMSLYVKYDLSPVFKDQAIDQNNISLGLRFDFD